MILFFLLGLSLFSAGEEETLRPALWSHTHTLSGLVDLWTYREPGAMKDAGPLYGINYTFRHQRPSGWYFEANLEFEYGRTTYEGVTVSTPTLAATALNFAQNNSIYLTQIWMGHAINSADSSWRFLPKFGALYRNLLDRDDSVVGDYQRQQSYAAALGGVDVFLPPGRGQWILSVQSTLLFRGDNESRLTDVGLSEDLSFQQKKGYGYSIEATYQRESWNYGVFARGWRVGPSETKTTLVPPGSLAQFHEPKNETFSWGTKIGYGF